MPRRIWTLVALLTLSPLLGAPAGAQSRPPAEVAAAFFGALERHDWPAATALVHPGAVERFRTAACMELVEWAERGRQDPDLPLGWHRERLALDTAALRAAADVPAPIFRGVRTVGDIADLAPAELLVRFLEAQFTGFHPRVARRILGAVQESDSIAHVLYRTRWGPGILESDPWQVDVLHLQRAAPGAPGGEWRVIESDLLDRASVAMLLTDLELQAQARVVPERR